MLWKNLYAQWRAAWQSRSMIMWLALVARSARILMFPRLIRALHKQESYTQYTAMAMPHDMFASLSYRNYLRQGLSARQRLEMYLQHCSFESVTFNTAYRQQVYLCGGLTLWERTVGEDHFLMRLVHSGQQALEGDLTVVLTVNQKTLHRISFSWVDGAEAGLPGAVVPFLTRNQSGWGRDSGVRERFDAAFPQNYPNFFCYVALEGLTRATGAPYMLGVPAERQVYANQDGKPHFPNTYDGFWETVGGAPAPALGFRLPMPMPAKPLEEVPSKHRKRAAQRRAYWGEIAASAHAALAAHLAPGSQSPAPAPAEAPLNPQALPVPA